MMFENYVNYAGSKTIRVIYILLISFENYVNYAGSKTIGEVVEIRRRCLRTM